MRFYLLLHRPLSKIREFFLLSVYQAALQYFTGSDRGS